MDGGGYESWSDRRPPIRSSAFGVSGAPYLRSLLQTCWEAEMITVRYRDEPYPITYLNEREREVVEGVKFLFGISVREVCKMAREIIRAIGYEFVLGAEVPSPYADVDLLEAWEIAQRDARACRLILEEDDPGIEILLRVYRNTMDWLRFWSVRFPSAEWRTEFAQELERREEGLANLRSKALGKGKLKVAQQLTTGD